MKTLFRLRRSTVVLLLMACCFVVFTKCINQENEKTESDKKEEGPAPVSLQKLSFQQFAGSATCAACHKDIYENHLHTAHYRTSAKATEKNIKGSFIQGSNTFFYNPELLVSMQKRDSGLYQVVYFKGEEKIALPFDLVIGSGAKGQSFAYEKEHSFFQLPITFFTAANQWANSPGFPGKVMMNRPITSRCLECHASFAEKISAEGTEPEVFDKNRMILGVDCEKCHGPAARHVAYQTQNPEEASGKFILNPSKLSRQQNLDLCALCHAGNIRRKQPPFSFAAGNNLSDYFEIDTLSTAAALTGNFDVHGNQYGMLRASKCFRQSQTLTCNTCHDPHKNERGQLALLTQRCMNCHNKEHQSFCTFDAARVRNMEKNCIDCHMPAQPSKAIALYLPGNDIPVASLIRSHFISIYKEETQKFIEGQKLQ